MSDSDTNPARISPPDAQSLAELQSTLSGFDTGTLVERAAASVDPRVRLERRELRLLEVAALARGVATADDVGGIAAIGKRSESLAEAIRQRETVLREQLAAIQSDPDLSPHGVEKAQAAAREAFAKHVEALGTAESRHVETLVAVQRVKLESELQSLGTADATMPAAERREHARDFAAALVGMSGDATVSAYLEFAVTQPWAAEALQVVALRLVSDADAWSRLRVSLAHGQTARLDRLLLGSDDRAKRLRSAALKLELLGDAERAFAVTRQFVSREPAHADLAIRKLRDDRK